MNESVNFSKTLSEFEDDRDTSNSVTIYEDDPDLDYFDKSSRARVFNSSIGKRSPLAILNTGSVNQGAGPSNVQAMKPPLKLDEAYVKRLQPKEVIQDPFQYLSDEVLLHIFTFLPKKALNRIAPVNERFSRVVQDDSLWVRMDLGNKYLRRGAISRILCRGLVILRLAQAKIQSPIFEPDFIADGYECKLQYLDLSMAGIDVVSLAQLLGTCRSLKKLSLEAVRVNDNVCREISQNQSLESLNLAMCEGLTTHSVTLMMENLTNLFALNISWTRLNQSSVDIVIENVPPTIQRLNIAGCRKTLVNSREFPTHQSIFLANIFSLFETDLKTLVQRCPIIVELDLSDCTMLTEVCMLHIMSFTKLEYLSLSRCYNITMTSFL